MSISTDDRLELHELPGRYGDAIDDRDWPKYAAVRAIKYETPTSPATPKVPPTPLFQGAQCSDFTML